MTLTDIQIELSARGGAEAAGIRLTRQEFADLQASRGRPADPLIQPERFGRPATVLGMTVTWVDTPVTPKLLPELRRPAGRARPARA